MQRFYIGVLLTLALIACDSSHDNKQVTTEPEASPAKTEKIVEISWEQLMPKGEQERLEELYANYYADLQNQMEQQAAQSSDTADNNANADGQSDTLDIVAAIMEGSVNDTMEQIGTYNVVEELDGLKVRLPGYVVPFDFSVDAQYREFLLVPYFGACLHTPPPPPNQIVYVRATPAASIDDINEPVWVEGVLSTGQFNSELGNSAYELALDKIEAYAY